ncbi:MAG: class I SAM-dependent methyltransferase [Anaerolineaceae bacterium]
MNETIAKWNGRYKEDLSYKKVTPRKLLRDNLNLFPTNALVLDIAMGAGGNADYLQKNGARVIGVDISDVAVRLGKKRSPELMAVIGDLQVFSFPEKVFDAIINFYYLQRDLISRFPRYLKPGGLVFMETLTVGMLDIKPDIAPVNLLADGELRNLFSGWSILQYGEGLYPSSTGSKKAIAWIVAQLPVDSMM